MIWGEAAWHGFSGASRQGLGKAKVEVATSVGETYIEALQAAAELIKEKI